MTFYLSLFIFIISIVAGLVLMIGGKGMSRQKFLLLTSIHLIFIFAFAASLILRKAIPSSGYNYFFMAFICSGLVLSGLAWRSLAPFYLRIYFSIFALTIPMFLISPSILLNFLLTMNFSGTNGPVFHLYANYYIEAQNSSRATDKYPHYKLVRKHGLFHQTIQRDLYFSGTLDSVRVIDSENDNTIMIRGFISKVSYVSSEIDSLDLRVPIKIVKQGDVEYHL
jgi:hypothetical protein